MDLCAEKKKKGKIGGSINVLPPVLKGKMLTGWAKFLNRERNGLVIPQTRNFLVYDGAVLE